MMIKNINSGIFSPQDDKEYARILQELESEIASLSLEEQEETRTRITKQIDARRTDDASAKIKVQGNWTCSVCKKEQHIDTSTPRFVWFKDDASQEAVVCGACRHQAMKDKMLQKEVVCISAGMLKIEEY